MDRERKRKIKRDNAKSDILEREGEKKYKHMNDGEFSLYTK